VNERVKRGDDWEDYPNFFECVMFGRRAESLSKIMTKGMKVALSGRLRYSSWDNKDGQRRSKVEVIAEDVDIMQRRDGNGQHGGNQGVPDGYSERDIKRMAGGDVNDASNYYDDDVPF
jgi:single-strand DNA-binding protein